MSKTLTGYVLLGSLAIVGPIHASWIWGNQDQDERNNPPVRSIHSTEKYDTSPPGTINYTQQPSEISYTETKNITLTYPKQQPKSQNTDWWTVGVGTGKILGGAIAAGADGTVDVNDLPALWMMGSGVNDVKNGVQNNKRN